MIGFLLINGKEAVQGAGWRTQECSISIIRIKRINCSVLEAIEEKLAFRD